MTKLEDLLPNVAVKGILPEALVTVAATERVRDFILVEAFTGLEATAVKVQ